MSPNELLARFREKLAAGTAAREARFEQGTSDWRKENRHRLADFVDGKEGHRDAKAASFPGQSNRSTPGRVRKDNAEDGWVDLPEPRGAA